MKRAVELDYVLPVAASNQPPASSDDAPFCSKEPQLRLPDVLTTSMKADGTISLPHAHVRMFFLLAEAVDYRRTHPDVSGSTFERELVSARLEQWFSELPADVQALDLGLIGPDRMGEPDGVSGFSDLDQIMATVLYTLVLYHTAHVVLATPAMGNFPSSPAWLATEDFVICHEHAMRATRLLQRFLDAGNAGHVCKPFFQYCVVRTGLVHLDFLYHQQMSSGQSPLQALTADDIHTAILYLGQTPGSGAGGIAIAEGAAELETKSHWFRVWLAALDRSPSIV
jgi:hypothetical protein